MIYLDTSALAKLVVVEPESAAVTDLVNNSPLEVVISGLCELELHAFGARHGLTTRVDEVLEVFAVLPVTAQAWAQAGIVATSSASSPKQTNLRALDALHLGVALVTPGVDTVATFDNRLALAATAAGLGVWPTER